MTVFQVIILSIIEGITEFLPISSTGHLLLAQKFFSIESSDFSKTFNIVIQLSAILAVVWLFRHKFLNSYRHISQTLVAFIPTGLIGVLLYQFIHDVLLENPLLVVYSLFFGGVILLLIDQIPSLHRGTKKIEDLNLPRLVNIGLFQSISIIPGISRSAATIIGGLVSGLSRSQAVEFSFYLAIPTMLAASGLDLLKSGLNYSGREYSLLLIGCIFSFISAHITVKFFLDFVKNHNFTYFAIYRMIFAFIVWLSL